MHGTRLEKSIPFIQSIRREPDNPMICLVYADWLEEQGEVDHAELIRIQWQLHALPKSKTSIRNVYVNENVPDDFNLDPYAEYRQNPRVMAMLQREQTLSKRLWPQRTEGFPIIDKAEWGHFERGLVRELTVRNFRGFLSQVDAITQGVALETLRITEELSAHQVMELVHLPILQEVRTLDLNGCRIRVDGLRAFLDGPPLARLRHWMLPMNFLSNSGIKLLAESSHCQELSKLFLAFNFFGDAGFTAILNSPYLTQLTLLDVRNNHCCNELRRDLNRLYGTRMII